MITCSGLYETFTSLLLLPIVISLWHLTLPHDQQLNTFYIISIDLTRFTSTHVSPFSRVFCFFFIPVDQCLLVSRDKFSSKSIRSCLNQCSRTLFSILMTYRTNYAHLSTVTFWLISNVFTSLISIHLTMAPKPSWVGSISLHLFR